MASVIICILAGLIVTDILSFSIYFLSSLFVEEKKDYQKNIDEKYKNSVNSFFKNKYFKEYMFFIFSEFRNNKKYFLIYYISLGIITVVITLFMINFFGFNIKGILALVFSYSLIVLTFVDAKTQMLPDYVTKPLIVVGLVQGYFSVFADLKSAVLGAVLGYGILWTINTLFKLARKKDGMGYGDFKLLAAMGAWVGYQYLPLMILMSSVIGIFVAVAGTKLAEKDISAPTPFGPSLAIAGLVSLCWGDAILSWYISLYGY